MSSIVGGLRELTHQYSDKSQYPGDPTLGGPGSEGHYWVRQLGQTCGGDLSSPLQRVASRFVRSQLGGTAWLEGKALPFQSRAAPTCSADAAAAYERSVDAGAS